MGSTPDWLPQLLKEQSFLQSHAFWNCYFHNHKAHSAIALTRMGATEERVKRHCQWQNEKSGIITFEKEPNLTQYTEVDSIKSDDIMDYLGKNVGYYKILDHFTKLYETKYHKDVKKLICGELPPLIDGPFNGVFHGIIQLGYGYAAGSDQVVLEGLAFSLEQYSLVTSSTDPKKAKDTSEFGKGTTDILDILKETRENKANDWKNLDTINTMVSEYGDMFLDFTDRVKLPEFFVPGKQDMKQAGKLLDWLLNMAAVLYVQSDSVNNFFLLHGITSSWSLLQALHLLDFDTAVRAIRAHLCALLMTYSSWCKAPKLTKKPEEYWKGATIDQDVWNEILKETIATEFENHIFKVVQCLYEAWKKNPESPFAKYYIAGSRMALDNDMVVSTGILKRIIQ